MFFSSFSSQMVSKSYHLSSQTSPKSSSLSSSFIMEAAFQSSSQVRKQLRTCRSYLGSAPAGSFSHRPTTALFSCSQPPCPYCLSPKLSLRSQALLDLCVTAAQPTSSPMEPPIAAQTSLHFKVSLQFLRSKRNFQVPYPPTHSLPVFQGPTPL